MRKIIGQFFMAAAILMVAITNPVVARAECDPNPCLDKQICKFGECRVVCCSDKECTTDGEVCYRKVCMPTSDVEALKARASDAARQKAEQDKADADAARQKAEQDKADADAARQKAEQDKADADAARQKAEQDKADAEKKATEEAAARLLAEAQAKASAEVAEKARKKALASEKTGHILLSLDTSLVVGGIPKEYDDGLVLPRFVLEGGWLFNPDGWCSFFLEGAMGGAKIPPLDDSKAWIVGAGGGAWLSPANFFHFAFALWYLGEIPQYREDGPPDSMGEVRIGFGFKIKNRFSVDGYWGGTFGDEEMEVLISRLGLILTGHW